MRATVSLSLLALYTTSAVASGWEAYGTTTASAIVSSTTSKTKVCKPKSTYSAVYPTQTYTSKGNDYSTTSLNGYSTVSVSGYSTVKVYPTPSGTATDVSTTTASDDASTTGGAATTESTSIDESTSTTTDEAATTTTTTDAEVVTSIIEPETPTTTIDETTTTTTSVEETVPTPTSAVQEPRPTNCSTKGADTCNQPLTNGNAGDGSGCAAGKASCICLLTTCGQAVCSPNASFDCYSDCDSDSDCGEGFKCVTGLQCNSRGDTGDGNTCMPVSSQCDVPKPSRMFIRAKPRMRRSPITKDI